MAASQDPVREGVPKGIKRLVQRTQWARDNQAGFLTDGQSTHLVGQPQGRRAIDGRRREGFDRFEPHPETAQRRRQMQVARRSRPRLKSVAMARAHQHPPAFDPA